MSTGNSPLELDLERVCQAIRRLREVSADDIVRLLATESLEARIRVNAEIADSYLAAGQTPLAEQYADRAFILSGHAEAHATRYLSMKQSRGDVRAVAEAWKRMGMNAAARGDVANAIRCFNACHYAHSTIRLADEYSYDYDIQAQLDRIAAGYRATFPFRPRRRQSARIRIAYLVYGASHPESVLIRILCQYAKWHDRGRFEVAFFVPDHVHEEFSLAEYRRANIAALESASATVIASNAAGVEDALRETLRAIAQFSPDVLVTTAALADYSHYLIAATRPARAIIGLNFASPQQFTPALLDWSICSHLHGTFESPCDSSLLPVEFNLPKPGDVAAFPRSELGIPDDATVLVLAGRPAKLQNSALWSCIVEILAERPGAWLLVIGSEEPPASIRAVVPGSLRGRMTFLGWRSDYLQLLRASDIMLDTYPSGGGGTLVDAMALGIPILAFRNDYAKAFTQTDWSVAEELVDIPELILPRGDFGRFKQAALRLIDDPAFRTRMGAQCAELARNNRGSPERAVRSAEQTFVRVLDSVGKDRGDREASIVARLRLALAATMQKLVQHLKRVRRRIAVSVIRIVLHTRLGVFLAKETIRLPLGLLRWWLDIESPRRGNYPFTCARFAACVNPRSKHAAVMGWILDGLDPRTYSVVDLQSSDAPVLGDRRHEPPVKHLTVPSPRAGASRQSDASWRGNWHSMLAVVRRTVGTASALKAEGADTLVACCDNAGDTVAIYLASKLLGCRFGLYWLEERATWEVRSFVEQFLVLAERLISLRVGFLILPSEFMQKHYIRRGRISALVAPPPPRKQASPPEFQDIAEPRQRRVVLGGPVNRSHRDLLNITLGVLSHLGGHANEIQLHSTQAASGLGEILAGIPHLSIHGGLTPAEVDEAGTHCDLQILPMPMQADARNFSMSGGAAEIGSALASGGPILAYCPKDSYLWSYLAQHDCGAALDGSDLTGAATIVESLFEDADSRARRRRNALERARIDFDPATARGKFVDALGMIVLPEHQRIPPPAPTPGKLRIALVSAYDVLGIQANGFLLHKHFQEQGHDSRMLVHVKLSSDEAVQQLGSNTQYHVNRVAALAERALSTRAVLTTLSHGLHAHPKVRDADIVSLQLIHSGPFFNMLDLPRLSREKRVVLSLHEMFFLTGHCVYSIDCERWKTGCGACPDLKRPFSIFYDTTALNWKLKRMVFEKSRLDLVVGSRWMKRQVQDSPLLSRFPLHYIPFGVDERVYRVADKSEARARLGIPDDAHVIAFRSAPHAQGFKGTRFIEAALSRYAPAKPTYLVTLDARGGLDSIRDKYRFVEIGWINDQARIASILNAADLFLMPSTAESFGLMAIESMACGTPVIVFEGTALPETVGAPHSGIAVPYGDSEALLRAIEDCLGNPSRLASLRESGLQHVATNHSFKAYGDGYISLFEELAGVH